MIICWEWFSMQRGIIEYKNQFLNCFVYKSDMEGEKAPEEHHKEDKTYIKSKKKWKDFKLH